jgi:hypothetical protein
VEGREILRNRDGLSLKRLRRPEVDGYLLQRHAPAFRRTDGCRRPGRFQVEKAMLFLKRYSLIRGVPDWAVSQRHFA